MSTAISEKLALIRESERLNRKQFAEITGVPYSSLTYYESGRTVPPTDVTMKILQNPRFSKYTLWFITEQISPESGQIAPALAHFGQETTDSQHSDQKTG
ncbi:helix-turn-helix domain-containing protein [Klebsiella variicola]|jgi:transcriptional regulator with XRE-family HTH domain|uniref:XRE family transcriptional regulator n=5 Tax=Klebsiella pneumoniae complex TaxID=3390273 RepID=A0A2A5MJM8_9ENTR|nr:MULTISPECIES: helix-turn-helix transcriptional regulator [Klebsiella/Raoultella group]HCA9770866.1 helix-turn-helix transcriptional regulator [Klebsiella variicola subsp. variicola]HDH1763829.1 helix-turn-helix transcriptional regulator [Klebsiella quasipneumoniae subsp. similipneumoniae]ASK73047.1 XRE family transcriptional regulator [Klebsiella michiganensis]ASZ57747.1 XRE family transcriptional regulator [Klebsiella michiganensis]AWX76341.1 XRE family transcriptional regulator [Klebsiell